MVKCLAERFFHNDEEEWRERAALPEAFAGLKVIPRSSINQGGDLRTGYESLDERYEICLKSHFLKNKDNEVVSHFVKQISKIEFQDKSFLRSHHARVDGSLEQKDGVRYLSLGDESSLIFRDEIWKVGFELGSQDFSYDFI